MGSAVPGRLPLPGGGPGVRREEETRSSVVELSVQIRVENSGLDHDPEVCRVDLEDPIHLSEVEHESAADRNGVALNARAGAPRGHRHT